MFLLKVFLFRPFFQQASPAEVNSRVYNPTCFNKDTIKIIWAFWFLFDVICVKKSNYESKREDHQSAAAQHEAENHSQSIKLQISSSTRPFSCVEASHNN